MNCWSSLFPIVVAVGTAVERCHGLVGRAYLYLHKVCALMPAFLAPLGHCGLARAHPRIFTSQNVVYLLSLKLHGFLKGLLDDENVRTGLAVEAKI